MPTDNAVTDIPLLYLMGAGRSGTTALTAFLNMSSGIHALGEMHQFPETALSDGPCACGAALSKCPYWSRVLAAAATPIASDSVLGARLADIERHKRIPRHLLGLMPRNAMQDYGAAQQAILSAALQVSETGYLLDSAKYIGRALALGRLTRIRLVPIYLVRDPRGVVHSFARKVQSPRGALSATLYYMAVNAMAELVRLTAFRRRVLKLRYEDMLDDPERFFGRIERRTRLSLTDVASSVRNRESFAIGHFIGGNRLKSHATITPRADMAWVAEMPRWKQLLIWWLTAPFNILNGYRP